jgi:flavin reductase (DIM6/NTAB) family NADH-FMN oxidoreductase RutF
MEAGLATHRDESRQHFVAKYRHAAGHWASGVAVTTTVDRGGRPFGLTMCAITSLSLDPLQLLICVDRKSTSLPAMIETRRFCINMLAKGQDDIARRFAGKSTDKFSDIAHRRTRTNLPLIDGTIGYIEAEVASILPGGDHEIIIGDVTEMHGNGGEPLVYFRGDFHGLKM